MSGDANPSISLPVGSRIAGLIFDLDGTLYINSRLRRAMLGQFLRAGLSRPVASFRELRLVQYYRRAQEHIRNLPEPLANAQLNLACKWSGASAERMAQAIEVWMDEAPLPILPLCMRPGIVELLEAAQNAGKRLGVLSDYPAAKKLSAMGLSRYFSVALSAQDAGVGSFKPSPKGVTVALKELGVPAAKAIYIGDRPLVDGEAARQAGVPCIVVGQPAGSAGPGWIGVPDVAALRAQLGI